MKKLALLFCSILFLCISANGQMSFENGLDSLNVQSPRLDIEIPYDWNSIAVANKNIHIRLRIVSNLPDSEIWLDKTFLENQSPRHTDKIRLHVHSPTLLKDTATDFYFAVGGYYWELGKDEPERAENQLHFITTPIILYNGYQNRSVRKIDSARRIALAYNAVFINDAREFRYCDDDKFYPWRDVREKSGAPKELLDSNLTLVFGNVAFGSNDIIKTGSAAALVQDKDKGTVSINYTQVPENNELDYDWAWNVGINAQSSGGFYNIFGPNSWYKNFGLTGGVTFVPHSGSQNYNCDKAADYHKARQDEYQYQSKLFQGIIISSPEAITSYIRRLDDSLSLYNNIVLDENAIKRLDSTRKKLKAGLKFRQQLFTAYQRGAPYPNYDSMVGLTQAAMLPWEFAHDPFTGYHFTFYDAKLGLSNTKSNLNADSSKREGKKLYGINSFVKLSAQISYNRNWLSDYKENSKGHLGSFQLTALFERSSLLDQPGITGTPTLYRIGSDTTQYAIINPDTKDTMGFGSQLNLPLFVATPSVYYGLFFGKGQKIGFDIRASYRWIPKFWRFPDSRAFDTYTITAGPVFRVQGEAEYTKATIGLKAGLINATTTTSRLWKDYFNLRLELGVPFKWYYKDAAGKKDKS